jgi:hypothetical protein
MVTEASYAFPEGKEEASYNPRMGQLLPPEMTPL